MFKLVQGIWKVLKILSVLFLSLCAISWPAVRNLKYCYVDLDLKHLLRCNLLVCIRISSRTERESDPIA